jgi:hypothetical protein
MTSPTRSCRTTIAGFSLVEVAVAVAVAAFCLITLIALLPTGITSNQISVEQTVATGLMSGIVADLRCTSTGTFVSPRYQIPLPHAADPATTAPGYTLFLKEDGSLSGTLNANADPSQSPRYRVLMNFYPPGTNAALASSKSTAATRVRILITWPAVADASVAVAPSNFTGSVETVIELNRNWANN